MAKSYKLVTTLSDGTEINAGTFEVPDASGGTIYRYVCSFITSVGAVGTFDFFSTDSNLTATDIYNKISAMNVPCCATDGTSVGIILSNLTILTLNDDLGKISSADSILVSKYEI